MPKRIKVFLDTSVLFAAVLSSQGGSRTVLKLGELGLINLWIGPNGLRECEEVIRRKIPQSLPLFAVLLDAARVTGSGAAGKDQLRQAQQLVSYAPDAVILAEVLQTNPDWFLTHDKTHFLTMERKEELPFRVSTPGDFLQSFTADYF